MTDTTNVTQADRDAAATCYAKMTGRGGDEATHADICEGRADESVLVQAFARHRLAHAPPAVADEGLAGQIRAAIDAYHDAMPQAQGESGDPFAAKEASKAMSRLLYNHADRILAALSTRSAIEADVREACAKIADALPGWKQPRDVAAAIRTGAPPRSADNA